MILADPKKQSPAIKSLDVKFDDSPVTSARHGVDQKALWTTGFGRNLTHRLVNWRDGLEGRFRFERAAVADPLEVRKVDREIQYSELVTKELRIRIVGLENQARRIRDDRATLWKR